MKKKLLALALMLSVTAPVMAAKQQNVQPQICQYTFLQNLIRDARSHERIFDLIKSGVSMDDTTIVCGGTLLQLAVRRGNPSIVNAILVQDKTRANKLVPTEGFAIPGAPAGIPAVLFAAYYSPSETVFNTFIQNGADISLKDRNGRDILWYLSQNPVLRQTKTADEINLALQNLLLQKAKQKSIVDQQAKNVAQNKQAVPSEKPISLDSDTFTLPQENNQ